MILEQRRKIKLNSNGITGGKNHDGHDNDGHKQNNNNNNTTLNNSNTIGDKDRIAKQAVVDLVKTFDYLPSSNPGFVFHLKLTDGLYDSNLLLVDTGKQTLSYRYKFFWADDNNTNNYSYQTKNGKYNESFMPSLGLLTSLMDASSGIACYSIGFPCSTGVSLQIKTERFVDDDELNEMISSNLNPGKEGNKVVEIDLITYVTKLGKSVSFTKTEFVHVPTSKIIAISSHVIYMASGNMVLDYIVTHKWSSNLFHNYVLPFQYQQRRRRQQQQQQQSKERQKTFKNEQSTSTSTYPSFNRQHNRGFCRSIYSNERNIQKVILDHLKFEQMNKNSQRHRQATFHATYDHVNGFGSLHGGCQSMILEIVGEWFVRQQILKNGQERDQQPHQRAEVKVTSQSLHIEYLSSIKCPATVHVCCCQVVEQSSSFSPTLSSSGSSSKFPTSLPGVSTLVRVWLESESGRMISDGTFRFVLQKKDVIVSTESRRNTSNTEISSPREIQHQQQGTEQRQQQQQQQQQKISPALRSKL